MKCIHLLLLTFGLIICSCQKENYDMFTKINADGSCYREIYAKADSAFMVGDSAKSNPLPIKLDTNWTISWQYITPDKHSNWPIKIWKNKSGNKKEEVNLTVSQTYHSVDDMRRNFRFNNISWGKLSIKYNFEKKFRWFYTYYSYSEVYPKINQFERIPISNYLTSEDIEIYFKGNSSLLVDLNGEEMLEKLNNISKSVDIWLNKNLYEEWYQILANNLNLLENYSISKERFISIKDSVYNKYLKKVQDKAKSNESQSEVDPVKALDYYLKTNAFEKMENKNEQVLKDASNQFESFIDYFNIQLRYSLEMPGKVLNTNSKISDGNKLVWNIDAYRFAISEHKIYAQSRKANTWAFILSGIILLLAISSIVYKSIR